MENSDRRDPFLHIVSFTPSIQFSEPVLHHQPPTSPLPRRLTSGLQEDGPPGLVPVCAASPFPDACPRHPALASAEAAPSQHIVSPVRRQVLAPRLSGALLSPGLPPVTGTPAAPLAWVSTTFRLRLLPTGLEVALRSLVRLQPLVHTRGEQPHGAHALSPERDWCRRVRAGPLP